MEGLKIGNMAFGKGPDIKVAITIMRNLSIVHVILENKSNQWPRKEHNYAAQK
jgi:hypothetical protein